MNPDPNVAHAAVIVDDGKDKWEITTLLGSFNSINSDTSTPDLTSMPWWDDFNKAGFFAQSVADRLSLPDDEFGPAFAHVAGATVVVSRSCILLFNLNCGIVPNGALPQTTSARFAVATLVPTVPLPAGLPILLTGLAGFAGLRMRKKWKAQV
ncbi:MAG: VPLPA-CTERM sorting domain-containing protein [Tateyamaria sp.]|uniref:VPLPA-CTERM sorting domain-containing protein n=1 Tax=Tateyamaria sp. TaxID=1929288 RepID=UPI00329F4188